MLRIIIFLEQAAQNRTAAGPDEVYTETHLFPPGQSVQLLYAQGSSLPHLSLAKRMEAKRQMFVLQREKEVGGVRKVVCRERRGRKKHRFGLHHVEGSAPSAGFILKVPFRRRGYRELVCKCDAARLCGCAFLLLLTGCNAIS